MSDAAISSRFDDETLALTGQGLRDTTRVAASDPELWVDVLAANAEPVARILEALRSDVERVVAALHAIGADPHADRRQAWEGFSLAGR